MEKILIIDDDVTFSLMLRTWLGKKGFGVDTAADIAAGRRLLAEGSYDLVLSDMRLPDGNGTDLLQWIAERGVTIPVIVMTGYAEIRNAVVSMKLGARDYVSKPVQPDELLRKIREALDAPHPETAMPASAAMAPAPAKPRRKGDRALDEGELNYIEGHSDASRKLYEYVRLVAPTNMSVLLEGASGTGKEHVARLIHLRSKRAGKPFVAVDCGALSRELAASEFFGHIKGSFTGALSDKKGAFESAQGGTLFLDEVGNLSYEVQIQLLRALQERRIKPVGGLREIPVDVRLICATNEDLEAAIARGSFRADLYHRIDEFVLHMPDLAERREDIMLYADFFLDQANRELDKHVVGFDPEAEKLLVACDWPGNLRQLKNAVTRAVLLTTGEYVTPAELPAELSEAVPAPIALRDPAGEEERIRRALAAAGGNKSQAARLDKHVVGFDPEAEKLLVACDWPGNLRQLKNAVTRAVLLTTGEYVTPAELPAELSEAVPAPIALRDPAGEEERIRRALAAAGGNKSQAARLLGIDRKTLYNKLHLYGIE